MSIGRLVKSHWSLNLYSRPITGLRTIFSCRQCFPAGPFHSLSSLPVTLCLQAQHFILLCLLSAAPRMEWVDLYFARLQYLFTPSSQAGSLCAASMLLNTKWSGQVYGGDHKHPIASVMQSLAFKAFSAGYFGNGFHSNWISAWIRAGFVGPVLHSWYRINHCVTGHCLEKSGVLSHGISVHKWMAVFPSLISHPNESGLFLNWGL